MAEETRAIAPAAQQPAHPPPTAEAVAAPPLSPAVLEDSRRAGRGTAPVRAAAIQRLQQSVGNHAVGRLIQRRASSAPAAPLGRPPISVQRHPVEEQDDELAPPVPVQATRSGAPDRPVQRNGDGPTTTAPPTTPAVTPPAVLDAPSTDLSRLDTIKNGIKNTTNGATALQTLTDKAVVIVFGTAGAGSFFASGANKITLNPGKTNVDLGFTLVHEANHAAYFHSKKTANTAKGLKDLSRDAYVNKMIEEETESTVRQIETKVELEVAAGGTLTGASTQAGERSYKKAYKAKYDADKAAGKTEEEAKAAARAAGAAEVKKDFEEGITIKTSTTHESYKIYYGKAWDKSHTPAP
ncbi:MAG TPA: DUF6782 family putative metallopeptidase [Chloroflexia bacterium]|nr:DUF6782 family putative metallopeptidase [Chloroflexia bacterium]